MGKKEQYALGIDLGGTNIKFGIVSESGRISRKISLDTKVEGGPEKIISQMEKGIKELLSRNKLKIKGIGVGSPGVVSTKKGIVENPPNFPGWGKVNLGRILEKKFKIKVYVENDANAAAIGEMFFGAGKKIDSFIMITLGTGVGGGIILKRKLYRGEFGAAGEIGHMTIDHNGPKCNCGSYGCIETYAGNSYLINRVKEQLKENQDSELWKAVSEDMSLLSPRLICEALKAGDRFSISVVKELGEYLGSGLASASNLLDISTFIFGGGVAGFGDILFDSIEETIKKRVLTPLRGRIKVRAAKLKNDAGIKGASALVFYKS